MFYISFYCDVMKNHVHLIIDATCHILKRSFQWAHFDCHYNQWNDHFLIEQEYKVLA